MPRKFVALCAALALSACSGGQTTNNAQADSVYRQALTLLMQNTFGQPCPHKAMRDNGVIFAQRTKTDPAPIFPVVVVCTNGDTYEVTGLQYHKK